MNEILNTLEIWKRVYMKMYTPNLWKAFFHSELESPWYDLSYFKPFIIVPQSAYQSRKQITQVASKSRYDPVSSRYAALVWLKLKEKKTFHILHQLCKVI